MEEIVECNDELFERYSSHKNARLEGRAGIRFLNKLVVDLDSNYEESGFEYGSPIEQFLMDNSGCIEAIQEWIVKNLGQGDGSWRENLLSKLPELDENGDEKTEDEENEDEIIEYKDRKNGLYGDSE